MRQVVIKLTARHEHSEDILTQEIVEKFTTIFVRVESVIDVWLKPGVYVTVVEFAIEDEEDLI